MRRTKPSEEPKDDLSDEDVQSDEKQSSDGSEFGDGGSRPADLLSQRGREVRHNILYYFDSNPTCTIMPLS
jgi:hypothetical protein